MQQMFLLNETLQSRPIIIYGAGNTGLDCFLELMNRDVRVEAFCDSNPEKWGIRLMNKRVMSTDELFANSDMYNVIIASQFYQEISASLEEHGVKNLYMYRDCWRVDW